MKRSNLAVAFCAILAVMFVAQPIFAKKEFLEEFKKL